MNTPVKAAEPPDQKEAGLSMHISSGPEPTEGVWPCRLEGKELLSREAEEGCLVDLRGPGICKQDAHSLYGSRTQCEGEQCSL